MAIVGQCTASVNPSSPVTSISHARVADVALAQVYPAQGRHRDTQLLAVTKPLGGSHGVGAPLDSGVEIALLLAEDRQVDEWQDATLVVIDRVEKLPRFVAPLFGNREPP